MPPDKQRQAGEALADGLAHQFQVFGEAGEILDMGAGTQGCSMAPLVIHEARNIIGGQRLGNMTIAAAVFRDSVHDDKPRLRSVQARTSYPGKGVPASSEVVADSCARDRDGRLRSGSAAKCRRVPARSPPAPMP